MAPSLTGAKLNWVQLCPALCRALLFPVLMRKRSWQHPACVPACGGSGDAAVAHDAFITCSVTASMQTVRWGEQEFPAIKSFCFILMWHQPDSGLAGFSVLLLMTLGGEAGVCPSLLCCLPSSLPPPCLGARVQPALWGSWVQLQTEHERWRIKAHSSAPPYLHCARHCCMPHSLAGYRGLIGTEHSLWALHILLGLAVCTLPPWHGGRLQDRS